VEERRFGAKELKGLDREKADMGGIVLIPPGRENLRRRRREETS